MQKNIRLTPRSMIAAALFAVVLITAGCAQKIDHTKGVYMLVDTSGTYTEELNKARAIINYLLGSLAPGDTMAVARIDTGSFSEKDIVAKSHLRPASLGGQHAEACLSKASGRFCFVGGGQQPHGHFRGTPAGSRIPERSRIRPEIRPDFLGSERRTGPRPRAGCSLSIGRVQHHRIECHQASGRYSRSQKLYAASGSMAGQSGVGRRGLASDQ